MWQVLRFLYFHQSVYIYIYLFSPLPWCSILVLRTSAHTSCAETRFFRSYRVQHRLSHTVRAGLDPLILIRVTTSCRNVDTIDCRSKSPWRSLDIYIIDIFGVRLSRLCPRSLQSSQRSYEGEGGGRRATLDPLDDTSLTLKFTLR